MYADVLQIFKHIDRYVTVTETPNTLEWYNIKDVSLDVGGGGGGVGRQFFLCIQEFICFAVNFRICRRLYIPYSVH